MFRKFIFGPPKNYDIRWRSHDIHRIEAFSDAVFGFAVTLLVVSLEVPKTFSELYNHFTTGLVGFLIGFVFLMLIWYSQYLFFRRFGLRDVRTIAWTAALLFVVLLYIYPTKFLFTYIFSGNRAIENGIPVKMVETLAQARQLMLLYCFGFTMVYFIFWQMYRHALKMNDRLKLTPFEKFIATGFVGQYLLICCIGVIATAIAYFVPPALCGISGYTFLLIYPVIFTYHRLRTRKLNRLFTPEEMTAHYAQVEASIHLRD